MDHNQNTHSSHASDQESSYSSEKQMVVGVSVILALALIGILGYIYVKSNIASQANTNTNTLHASTNQLNQIQAPSTVAQVATTISTTAPTAAENIGPSKTLQNNCAKNGPAQKWEYLDSYTVQAGDTLQNIAATQLHDASRVNEIVQLNGTGPYVVGTTLYLPPPSVSKSSGNLEEVYGMLYEKNASFWHISYSSDPKGLGILIPSFWFDGVANSNAFTVGDCIKVFFDNGNKVYTVSLQ